MQKNWRKMLTELGGWDNELMSAPAAAATRRDLGPSCTCPSGDGSLRWPCPIHPK